MVRGNTKLAALDDKSGAVTSDLQRAFWEESEAAVRRFGIQLTPRVELQSMDNVDEAFLTAP